MGYSLQYHKHDENLSKREEIKIRPEINWRTLTNLLQARNVRQRNRLRTSVGTNTLKQHWLKKGRRARDAFLINEAMARCFFRTNESDRLSGKTALPAL